jgi:hypothetical protein
LIIINLFSEMYGIDRIKQLPNFNNLFDKLRLGDRKKIIEELQFNLSEV